MSYKSGYQGGPYFELFSTQGRDFLVNWKGVSSSKKIYEKEVKGYVLCLEGSPATTKIQSPKDQKQSLTLIQRFLILQLYLTKGSDFSIELGVTDLSNNKRRLLLSTAQKETQVTPLHAKIPLGVVRRAVWVNLALDMVSLVGETWTSQTFRCVDQIYVSANCKLRRIFTMKSQPPDTTDDDELYGCSPSNSSELDSIPKQLQIAPDVTHLTQVLTLHKIKCSERLRSAGKNGPGLAEQFRPGSTLDLDLNASGRKVATSENKIAFGSKAPRAPDTSRKSARQGSLTTRSFRSQTSRIDAASNINNSAYTAGGGEESLDNFTHNDDAALYSNVGSEVGDGLRTRPPASANAAMGGQSSASSSVRYSRQQSEPVTHDDFGFITNGMKGLMDKQIVAPHPPREPSNDRARRRPRIKSIGQNGVLAKGEANVRSPPSSASVLPPSSATQAHANTGQPSKSSASQPSSSFSPDAARTRQRLQEVHREPAGNDISDNGTFKGGHSRMRDSGVGPDVPEIQSPRKGDGYLDNEGVMYNEMDSVSDVISLLKGVEDRIGAESRLSMESSCEQEGRDKRLRGHRDNREGAVERALGRIGSGGGERGGSRSGSGREGGRVGSGGSSRGGSGREREGDRGGRLNARHTPAALSSFIHGDKRSNTEDNESNVSTSASESSHPGEYEDSDEENASESNKLHLFVSPPKSAGLRRNISPNNPDADTNQTKRSFAKTLRSNIKRNSAASLRGARLEDDFVSQSSGDEDELPHHNPHYQHHNLQHSHSHHSQARIRRSANTGAANGFHRIGHHHHHHNSNNTNRSSTSGYNSSNFGPSTSNSSNNSGRSGQPMVKVAPVASASPDQRRTFDPAAFADIQGMDGRSGQNGVSRMSRKSLREITNPNSDAITDSNKNGYDFNKYTTTAGDLTESFEAGMFASMRRQTEAEYEDISPRPVPTPSITSAPTQAAQTAPPHQFHGNLSITTTTLPSHHLCSESPATTSDDDTSFSTWKAPAANQAPHNYHEEMKSRRSSDTLTSSNPRDWSGVMSPPIVPLSNVQDLQGTMEGISDDLSDDPVPSNKGPISTGIKKSGSEEEKLDLLFDPKLNCYFDPKTNKWYELVT